MPILRSSPYPGRRPQASGRSLFATASALLLLAATTPAAADAQGWSSFPQLRSGQQVAIAPSLDGRQWDSVRACLPDLDSAVGATYYAAVVPVTAGSGSSSPNESNAVPYADALYQHWQRRGGLDPERYVLMVVGLDNRSVAIRPGDRFADAGFVGQAVTQAILSSRFGDLASSGNMGWALCELAESVDRDLARRIGGTAASPPSRSVPPPPNPPVTEQQTRAESPNPAPQPARRTPSGSSARAKPGDSSSSGVGCVLGLLVLAMGIPFGLRLRRKKAHSRFLDEQKPWKQNLGNAAERLLELERHHPIYFSTEGQRWTGESQEVDQACADAVNRVYLLYAQATDLLGRAETLAATAGWASAAPFDQARDLLRDTEIVFDTGAPAKGEDHRRIFLPLTVEVRTTARRVLADLDAAYGEAMDRLDQVAAIDNGFRDRMEVADLAAGRAMSATEARRQLGFSTEEIVDSLKPHLDTRETALVERADPIRGTAMLEQAIAALDAISEATEAGNARVEELRGSITEQGRRLRARLETLRSEGLEPKEPGFDPDLRLDRGVVQADRIQDLIAEGRDEEAASELEALRRGLGELEEQLDSLARAPRGVPEALDALRAEARGLRDRLPVARKVLGTLEREHAKEAFSAEADNLDELGDLLDELEGWIEHIAEDQQNQHYLSALTDLETSGHLVDRGTVLLDELEQVESELGALRDEVRQRGRALADLLQNLDDKAEAPGVARELGEQASSEIATVRDWLESSGLLSDSPNLASSLPNWPSLDSESAVRVADMQRWHARLWDETEAHSSALEAIEKVEKNLRSLDEKVRSEQRDRPHVLESVQQVRAALEELRPQGRERTIGGNALLSRVEDLQQHLEWSRGIFESELDAIHLAESELASARAFVDREHGRDLGHGVRTDCSGARDLLDLARRARGERDWESVLDFARRSIETLHREVRRAREEAAERERQWQWQQERRREEERRRQEQRRRRRRRQATMTAARVAGHVAGAALSTWSHSRGSGSSFGSSVFRGGGSRSRGGGSRSGGASWGGGSRSGGASW